MLRNMMKWLQKIASDAHSAIVGLILAAIATPIVIYADRILNQTTKALTKPMPLWVTVSTGLGVLLICLLFLRKSYKTPKTEIEEPINLSNETVEILRTIAAIENPLESEADTCIDEQFLAETFKLSPQKTKHHLEQLHEAGFIIYSFYGDLKGLSPGGRDFLNSKGMMP